MKRTYTLADENKARHNRQINHWISKEQKAINFIKKNNEITTTKMYMLANQKKQKTLRASMNTIPLEIYF